MLVMSMTGVALANTGNMLDLTNKGQGTPFPGVPDGREGGETVADCYPIGSLPFSDTGYTCDNINDYDEVCPYTGSTSPDVVYCYSPAADGAIDISLCDSMYDTKVYVYENAVTPGAPHACNDDAGCGYSGFQSELTNVPVTGGNTYFIVVDGYGGSCGDYIIDVVGWQPCDVDCTGAMPEGEPPLAPNYIDNWNGGCNSSPYVWQHLSGDAVGHLDFCGHSGNYTYYGSNYRDTDWLILHAGGTAITIDFESEYPVNVFELNVDYTCANISLLQQWAPGACDPTTMLVPTVAGGEYQIWVGPQVFSGLPEFEYLMNIDGLEAGGVPVESSTWGNIKNMYK
jgi:hypothetical protein